jgi:hypothetical protein
MLFVQLARTNSIHLHAHAWLLSLSLLLLQFQKEMEKFRKENKLDEVMKQAGELMRDPKAIEEMAEQVRNMMCACLCTAY